MTFDPTFLPERLHERVCSVSTGTPDGAFVLYWMHHALRAHENPALDVALATARRLERPLLVYQGLSERHEFASDRHHTFALEGARDVGRELAERGVAYALHVERDGHRGPHLRALCQSAAVVVTEEFPVAPVAGWTKRLRDTVETPVWTVDASCIAPMPLVHRPYDRAFKFREAVLALQEERLDEPWQEEVVDVPTFDRDLLPFEPVDLAVESIAKLVAACEIDHSVGTVPHTPGGSVAGYERWDEFRDGGGLARYAADRNDAAKPGVSRLSPYLHYGMVSPFRVAREASARGGKGAEKFLDELLVWRELAFAFCRHRPEHASLQAVPEWALETLDDHAADDRPRLFDWESLARGRTGDEVWDLAQRSLLVHGELHNNLRMTWGKALLPWTDGPEEAYRLLQDLNHRYALDGRDPASYGGLLWCLGQFDRPFRPERPVFGTVRHRTTREHRRRLDVAAYAAHVRRPRGSDRPRVAVVGAGVAGLACARTLSDHGLDVTVFDKGRRPGGRTSTRRQDGFCFDHGAQYFTASDDRFRRHVAAWERQGVVAEWTGTVVEIDADGRVREKRAGSPRYVGTPGMDALCGHLASDVKVECGVQVEPLLDAGPAWELASSEGPLGSFDELVLTLPAPQASRLLTQVAPSLAESVEGLATAACWSVLLAVENPLGLPFDGAFVQGSPLSWVARDSSKPGRSSSPETWVLHGSAEWSAEHLEDEPDAVAGRLVDAFTAVAGRDVTPGWHRAHRWRFALPADVHAGPRRFDELRLTLGGDWLAGPRVESAFLSGQAAAGRLLGVTH